jgi:hypothetical protein
MILHIIRVNYILLRTFHIENIEWMSKSKEKCIVWYKKPREWADLLEKWVNDNGFNGSVLTLYELIHGDLTIGQGEFFTIP